MRVCPLLERESSNKSINYAPSPWILKECLETGLVYLENPPEYDRLVEDYAWEKTSKIENNNRRIQEPLLYSVSTYMKYFRGNVLKRNKLGVIIDSLVRKFHDKQVRLLDLGCGWGGLLQNVINKLPNDIKINCVPFGIEISNDLSIISNEILSEMGGGVIHDSALNGLLKFSTDYFNIIIMSSFLEHEINPMPLLRRCFERLSPRGFIVIKVPNYACINRIIRGSKWCGFRWPDHVNYFTPTTLRFMAERVGFEIYRMKYVDRHPFSDSMYAIIMKSHGVT